MYYDNIILPKPPRHKQEHGISLSLLYTGAISVFSISHQIRKKHLYFINNVRIWNKTSYDESGLSKTSCVCVYTKRALIFSYPFSYSLRSFFGVIDRCIINLFRVQFGLMKLTALLLVATIISIAYLLYVDYGLRGKRAMVTRI